MLTIDASVWINSVCPAEPNHGSSRLFLDHVIKAGLEIVVPTLLRVEVAATMSRGAKSRALVGEASQIFELVGSFRWIALDEYLANIASELATSYRLRGADAVYAAVAAEFGSTLVSLDNEHLERLKATALEVVTPNEALLKLLKDGS